MASEYSISTQMANQKEIQGSKENVKKEEVSDHYSTIANAGDLRKPLEKAKRSISSMFRRFVKVEISPAEADNKEFGEPAKTARKDSNILSSPHTIVKKEEHNENVSTVALHDSTPPTFPSPRSTIGKIKKKKKLRSPDALKFNDGAPGIVSVSPVSSTVHVVPANTTLSESANMAVARQNVSTSSSSTKRSRNRSPERNESRSARTSFDTGVNKHSIWESNAEDSRGDESSDEGGSVDESRLSNKRVVGTNADDANSVFNGGQFACLDCAAVFETNDAFNVHITSHEGYRRYKCNVCEGRFFQRSHLNDHLRIHTGEKPFKCDVCEKTFTTSGQLTVHSRVHTGERPFKCPICEKRFAHSTNLQRHKYIHTGERPFKCTFCDKGFVRNEHLHLHNRIHTGEKPFKCAVCDKNFSTSSARRRHKLIHTGEKPYKCLTCGKCFRQNCHLQAHTRIHTDSNGVTRQDVSQDCMDRFANLDVDSVDGQNILYKSKSMDKVVEQMTRKYPEVVFLVWSKRFTMELASVVARSGYNCILCVRKIEPVPFQDVLKLSNNVQTCLFEVGSETLRLFSFGGMILPEKITKHRRFKSLAKLESKLKRFSCSQGMELVNIFKHTEKKSVWYESLRIGLKEECIITDLA